MTLIAGVPRRIAGKSRWSRKTEKKIGLVRELDADKSRKSAWEINAKGPDSSADDSKGLTFIVSVAGCWPDLNGLSDS